MSSRIDLGKCHKEIATLREDCTLKNYIIKVLIEDLSKCTNSFYKVNQENNNPSYTDVNSQNDQPFVSPKKSIKINNKNTNRAIDVTRNNFVCQSHFSVLNCGEVSNNVLDDETNIFNVLKRRHNDTTRPIQNVVQNPRQPPVVVNNSPQNHHGFRRLKTVPGENSYSEFVSNSTASFNRNTKAKISNSIRSGRVTFRHFPGQTSEELWHFVNPTLAEGNYDTAIVHVGTSDITNDDSSAKVENLVLNLEKITIKLKKYGIKNVCLSGSVFTTRVYLPLLNQVNKCILDICKAHNISVINNDNIIRNDIYSDG